MAGRTELRVGAPKYPILDAFIHCRDRVSFIRGPLGSGKTMGTLSRLLLQMCEQKPVKRAGRWERLTRWLAIRNTVNDLTETTIRDFLEIFEDGSMGSMSYGDPPQFEVRMPLGDGSHVIADVIFLALDRPDSIKKLKGYQITGAWLNEVSELDKGIVDMVDLRHGRYPSTLSGGIGCTWHGMFGDTNSYDSTHWLYEMSQQRPEGWRFFTQPGGVLDTGKTTPEGRRIWAPNPRAENLENLPENYYGTGCVGKDDDWIKVMLANEIGFYIRGKPVHPRFLHSRHVASEPLRFDSRLELLFGLDFGRTPAGLVFQRNPSIGRYYVLREMTTHDMSAALFAPEFKLMLDREFGALNAHGWGDPAGDEAGQATEDTPIRICKAAGLPVQPAPSNIPSLRRAALDNPLTRTCMDGGPAVLVDPRCEMFVKGLMGGFQYPKLQVGGSEARYGDRPLKNQYSHICEAGEYGFLGAGEGREALRPASRYRDEEPYRYQAPRYSELEWDG